MAFTLFDQMAAAHRKVGTIQFDTSSQVLSTDGYIQSQRFSTATADDVYNNGTLFLSTLGVFSRILDYDASSGQFAYSTADLSTAVISSALTAISFGYTTPEFTAELMVELANDALRSLGPLVFEDRSIVSSANQQVYTMSTSARRGKPILVEMMGRLGSSTDDPEWFTLNNWKVRPSSAGAGHLIEFDEQLPTGRDIRIWYDADHQRVDVSTAIIDDRIAPEVAVLALVEKMYEYRNSRSRGAEEFDIQRWNDAKQQLAEARVRWPIWRPKRKPKLMVPGDRHAPRHIEGPPYGSR